MGATTSLQKLTRLIQRYESDGGCVKRVEAETAEIQTEAEMSVTLDVAIPLCSDDGSASTAAETATVTGNGGLQVEFSSAAFPSLDDYVSGETTVTPEAAHIADDGTIVTTFIVGFGAGTDAPTVDARSGIANSADLSADDSAQADGTTAVASAETAAASLDDDGAMTESSGGDTDVAGEKTDATADAETELERKLAAARSEDVPPYDDTEYLQCLYDSLDTFTEMAEHIEMDVASETVRRYMTESGVHQPSTYDTTDTDDDAETTPDDASPEPSETADGAVDDAVADDETPDAAVAGDGSATETPAESTAADGVDDEPTDPIEQVSDKPLVADGSGLPDDVDIEELADALESCMTLHQIQRRLGLTRERTREVLNELDLIDLVMRRISHDPDREVSRSEIADRIRGSASEAC
ncbi:MAG: hypothetical protein ABEH81_03690 [Halopenitus sp.]